MNGYIGSSVGLLLSVVHWLVDGEYSSGTSGLQLLQPSTPPRRSRLPLGSTVVEAYQVGKALLASCAQVWFDSWNPVTLVLASAGLMPPPPTVMTRPSGSMLLPPHDGLANGSGMLVKVSVVGSHTTAGSPWLLSPQVKTLPSGNISPCIATMGQFVRLPHWPVGSEPVAWRQ